MRNDVTAPRKVVAAAAQRLAGHMDAMRSAHDEHNVPAGAHDDLSSVEYAAATAQIYRSTLGEVYLKRLGLTFGAVTILMDMFQARAPESTFQTQWSMVRSYFASTANVHAPHYHEQLGSLPSLVLATQSTPPIVRFDLLAQTASRAAVLRMADAANWVLELTAELPSLDTSELDAVSLAALQASQIA